MYSLFNSFYFGDVSGWKAADEGMSPVAHLKLEVWNAWVPLGVTGGYHILQILNSNDFTLNKVVLYNKVI